MADSLSNIFNKMTVESLKWSNCTSQSMLVQSIIALIFCNKGYVPSILSTSQILTLLHTAFYKEFIMAILQMMQLAKRNILSLPRSHSKAKIKDGCLQNSFHSTILFFFFLLFLVSELTLLAGSFCPKLIRSLRGNIHWCRGL